MKKKINGITLYVVISSVLFVGLLLILQLKHGTYIEKYFWHDTRDTAMDFFHSIEYVKGREPYKTFGVLYPPLANLLFLFIYHMIPGNVSKNWTMDFIESIGLRGTNFDLRTYQAPLIIYLVFIIICFIAVVELSQYFLKDKKNKKMISYCIALSYGMLFSLERGNITILAWIFLMIFLMFYQSENKKLKELALISLAVSFGLKLYPAFFGILLIQKKQYKEAVRTIIYGILCIILPCLFFKEGIGGLAIWIKTVISYSNSSIPHVGNGFVNTLYCLQKLIHKVFGVVVPDGSFTALSYLVTLLLLIFSFFQKKEWRRILFVTFAMMLCSSQGDYIFMFLTIPILFLLKEETEVTKDNCILYFGLILLTANIPLFYTRYESYPRNTMTHIVISIMLIEMFSKTIKYIILQLKSRKNNKIITNDN